MRRIVQLWRLSFERDAYSACWLGYTRAPHRNHMLRNNAICLNVEGILFYLQQSENLVLG